MQYWGKTEKIDRADKMQEYFVCLFFVTLQFLEIVYGRFYMLLCTIWCERTALKINID